MTETTVPAQEPKPFKVLAINDVLAGCPLPETAMINGVKRPVQLTTAQNYVEAVALLQPQIDIPSFNAEIQKILPQGWEIRKGEKHPLLFSSQGDEISANIYGRPQLHEALKSNMLRQEHLNAIDTRWDFLLEQNTIKPFNLLITEETIQSSSELHSPDVRWGLDLAVIALRSDVPRIGIRISDHSNLWPPGRKVIGNLKLVVFAPGEDWDKHAVKDLLS